MLSLVLVDLLFVFVCVLIKVDYLIIFKYNSVMYDSWVSMKKDCINMYSIIFLKKVEWFILIGI